MERHWKVTGVGDLDDVGSDVTKHNGAEVQDVLRQLDSETGTGLSLLVTFKPGRPLFPKGESEFSPCEALFSRVENS